MIHVRPHESGQPTRIGSCVGDVQVVEVVCCRPSQLQRDLYEHFLRSNAAQRLLSSAAAGKAKASALTAINALRKLCGHPKLIYDVLHPATGKAPAEADGFKVLLPLLSGHCQLVRVLSHHRDASLRHAYRCGSEAMRLHARRLL